MELQKKTKKYKNPNPPAACIILCMLVLVKQNGQQEQFRSEQPPQGAAGELKSKWTHTLELGAEWETFKSYTF